MSVGSATGISNLVTYYSDLSNLDLLAGQARAANTAGGSRQFLFGGTIIDDKNRNDGSQSWGRKWLDSYRTVLVQRAQTLQRKLNNIYTEQLGNNLYKSIADNPNYSMADLQRQDNGVVDPVTGDRQALDPSVGASIFSMLQDMNGATRASQDPTSYQYGLPDPGFFDFTGKLWDPLTRNDWGTWASRQYDKPNADLRMPWEHISDYFEIWNPFGGGPMPTPPKAVPLIPPAVYFKMFDFVGDMLMPLFYPMIFSRYETFAHSDAANNAIDASVIRSDYNFTSPGIGQFPIVGQVLGGVMTGLIPVIAAIPDANGQFMTSNDIKACLDILTNKQSNAMAPRMVETETGGFFAATQALQDWDLDNMSYQYYSATNYQEDFVDTDFLAAFRKAGAKLFKILVNAILTATGIGNILKIPPLSFIADMLLEFISTMLMDGLLGPIRKFVETDTQYDRTGAGLVDADATSTLHVGDPGGLFGLDTAWEPGGYALAYRDDNAYNVQALNSVTVYTNKKTISSLWDGRGVLDSTDWEGKTFQSVSSRVHNVGYATNPPLNLSTFRYNTQDRYTDGANTDKMDFDSSTGPNEQPHGTGGTYNRADDYALTAATKLGDQIKTGSRTLNPSFGGGIRLTDLDTNLDDIFFYGSAAFLPDNGNSNVLTLSGTDFVAQNNGVDESGNPITTPSLPTTPNGDAYTYAKMGTVTFDGTSPTTDAYVFAPTDDNGVAITGLKVTYNGPDCLTGPSNAQPVNIVEAYKPANYRVTNTNGDAITAEILVDKDQIRIDHGTPPGIVAAGDWIMANSTSDSAIRTPQGADANSGADVDYANPNADDKTSDYGRLDLGLGARIEPLLPQTVNPLRDDDTTTGWDAATGANDKDGYNFSSLQLVDPAITNAILESHLEPGGTVGGDPETGHSFQTVNTATLATGVGLPASGSWSHWDFVSGRDMDFSQTDINGDGNAIDPGAVNPTFGNSIETASAQREAWIAWDRLVQQSVPASFVKKENASANPATDEWNIKLSPWNPNTGQSGDYVSPIPSGVGSATRPLPSTFTGTGIPPYNGGNGNPYYWTQGNYEYITVWSNRDLNADGIPDERDTNGLPTASAVPLAVYRYDRSGNGATQIQMLGSNNAAAATQPRPVLMHRETQILTMEDDSALGPNSKLLRTLDHLRSLGYTQGRSPDDTAGAFYNLQGSNPPAAIPPAGTPGDFTIMNSDGKTVTIGFTKPYSGLVDVPPNQDAAGNPKEDWTAVNGWTVYQTIDGNVGTSTYTAGAEKIWLDKSVPGSTDNIWAIQDFSHPTGATAYPTTAGGATWSGAGFGTTYGAIWGGTDGPGRDEVSLGRKFTIPNVSSNPADHYVRIRADDGAAVFINGQYIGQGAGYASWTTLAIPPSALRPGENIVTVQSIDRGGPAGVECEVVADGTQVANTSPAQASQWQVLNSPQVSTPDEMVLKKTVTFASPDGTHLGAAAPDGTLTGDILPGEFVDMSWAGVNTGAAVYSNIYPNTGYYDGGSYATANTIAALIPDKAVLTITNAKGTFQVPLTQYDSNTKQWVQKNDGSGTFHIPTDYLAAGGNTFSLDVERGGKVYQFAMNEPPSAPPTGWLYRNLAQGQVQQAGYWVNGSNLLDDDGTTVLVPAGSLMYGGKVVQAATPGVQSFQVINGIIHRNTLGTLDAVKPGDYSFKPDSYFNRPGTTIDGQPMFVAAPGGSSWAGYQLKSDVRTGMSMANSDTSQEIHTYATSHVDRYVFDPNTQTIMDVMAANQNGLESTSAANPGGSETQDVPYTGSTDTVNTTVPLMLPGQTTPVTNGGGAQILPGSTGVGKAPVGIRITNTDRQTFGSDDNQLTRTLYAALTPIDLDGVNEDLNGNGILDAGEDTNGNGVLDNGTMEADTRAYKEYRDCFNYGLLDHLYISGTAYSPTGGGFSSVLEFNWKATDVKDRSVDHLTTMGTEIQGTTLKTQANSYMNNYEYFANETDRRNKKYTVVRRGDLLMDSFYSFRKEQ